MISFPVVFVWLHSSVALSATPGCPLQLLPQSLDSNSRPSGDTKKATLLRDELDHPQLSNNTGRSGRILHAIVKQ